jgi:hypothetical protein
MHWRTDDIFSGLIFLAVSVLFGTTALRTLEIGTPGLMGPGFFPLMISIVLAAISVVIIAGARSNQPDAKRKPISWRAVIFIIGSAVVFGATVRNVGLVPALAVSVALAVLASRQATFVRGAMIVVGMTVFCVLVFSYGIGLTVELFASEFWRWH